jgi:hypothetical protein
MGDGRSPEVGPAVPASFDPRAILRSVAEQTSNETAQRDGRWNADMALVIALLGGGPATDAERSRSRTGLDRTPTEAGVEGRGRS